MRQPPPHPPTWSANGWNTPIRRARPPRSRSISAANARNGRPPVLAG